MNKWVEDMWEKATIENRESVWNMLPENIFDSLEDPTYDFDSQDVEFMRHIALYSHRMASEAAIRTLGLVAEVRDPEGLEHALISLLTANDEKVRYWAASSLREGLVYPGIPYLRAQILVETQEDNIRVMKESLEALEFRSQTHDRQWLRGRRKPENSSIERWNRIYEPTTLNSIIQKALVEEYCRGYEDGRGESFDEEGSPERYYPYSNPIPLAELINWKTLVAEALNEK